MPIPTPFHVRTAALNESFAWRDWSGFLAASRYEPFSHERECFAIRNSAALIDISPLFKYEVSGPDAARLLNRIMTRDMTHCRSGQVMYSPWCDDLGKVIDDGTISRIDDQTFRVTSAHPNLRWFQDAGKELDAQVDDISARLAALALQGPKSRAILQAIVSGMDLDQLAYFRVSTGSIEQTPITVTRTGYTGDLGYELWLPPESSLEIWDKLVEAGQNYALLPTGMLALDIARIEAGFLLIDVDYISAREAYIPAQKSSPFELGLEWAVSLEKEHFIGRQALLREKENGSRYSFVGIQTTWPELERLYGAVGLRPTVAGTPASRNPIPIYKDGRQIGQATSHVFSPLLKRYIALGTVEHEYDEVGTAVDLEMTVEFQRELAKAVIVDRPFYNPVHKLG